MTPGQVVLVGASFQKLVPAVDTVGQTFYQRLFATHLRMCAFFRGEMENPSRAWMEMIELIIKTQDLHDKPVPLIHFLGYRHAAFAVESRHYAPFGEALIKTLALTLGDGYTPDVRGAGEAAYDFMADNMQ